MSQSAIYKVQELTAYIKHLLEEDPLLQGAQVAGEVSNLTYHRSGHVYFSLKDKDAQLSCVMFRSHAQYAPRMQVGDQVICTGSISVYAPRGNYQMMVRQVRAQGLGDLYQRFMALKQQLTQEGLFDPVRKKPIPSFPRAVAILTSPTGAAIQDMIRTIKRRFPVLDVTVIPTVVQGANGLPSIIRSLEQAADTPAEVLILARGGGSLEDLWNFNEEAVVRAMVDCPLPIVTGIGHETDTTLADFAADLRASTPTAAAEAVSPDRQAILRSLSEQERQMQRSLQYFIDFKRQILDDYGNRMEQAMHQYVQTKQHSLNLLEAKLQGLDPRAVLRQGFSLVLVKGKRVRQASELASDEVVDLVFDDGRKQATVLPDQDAAES